MEEDKEINNRETFTNAKSERPNNFIKDSEEVQISNIIPQINGTGGPETFKQFNSLQSKVNSRKEGIDYPLYNSLVRRKLNRISKYRK